MPYLLNIVHSVAAHYPGISSVSDIPIIEQLLISYFGSAVVFLYYTLTSLPVVVLVYFIFIAGEYAIKKTVDGEE
ncbi:hypothetical protein C7B77_21510 [Chamaesiphon polymorphus CCALA 037]|uniref:Uncharacterized protein n=2 Tax=Chamaesiphon TaxID=217161 RepID=A0A2T1G2N4_9CYAN|nr:hypothetical protein C7B77_21510 [Chamaesiphon polymorphus CCALA 037]